MLASVNKEHDMEIFLTDDEVYKLRTDSIEGKILDLTEDKLHTLRVSLDARGEQEWTKRKSGNGIGREIINNNYIVYVSGPGMITDYYSKLIADKYIGTRYGNIKIDIMEEDYAMQSTDFGLNFRILKSLMQRFVKE